MMRGMVGAVLLVWLVAAPLAAGQAAGQAKAEKPVGTWTKAGDLEVKFEFAADTLKCTLSGGGITIAIDADYGMAKDGTVFGRINKVEKKGADFGPQVGDLFTFHVRVKGDTLTLFDLGPAQHADARQLIEGDYKGAPQKK